jgi:hypothetical protein
MNAFAHLRATITVAIEMAHVVIEMAHVVIPSAGVVLPAGAPGRQRRDGRRRTDLMQRRAGKADPGMGAR